MIAVIVFGGFFALIVAVPVVLYTVNASGVLGEIVVDQQTVKISKDEYAYSSFWVRDNKEIKILVEVRTNDSSTAHAQVLDDRYFGNFESLATYGTARGNIIPITGLSQGAITGTYESAWIKLDGGNYHLVVTTRPAKHSYSGECEIYYKIVTR